MYQRVAKKKKKQHTELHEIITESRLCLWWLRHRPASSGVSASKRSDGLRSLRHYLREQKKAKPRQKYSSLWGDRDEGKRVAVGDLPWKNETGPLSAKKTHTLEPVDWLIIALSPANHNDYLRTDLEPVDWLTIALSPANHNDYLRTDLEPVFKLRQYLEYFCEGCANIARYGFSWEVKCHLNWVDR